jgi:hypothetical protein
MRPCQSGSRIGPLAESDSPPYFYGAVSDPECLQKTGNGNSSASVNVRCFKKRYGLRAGCPEVVAGVRWVFEPATFQNLD